MAHHSTGNSPRARRAAFTLVAFVSLGVATPCAWDFHRGPTARRSPAGDSASTPPDLSVVVEVLANDTDADKDDLDVTSVSSPAHGTVTGARRRISGVCACAQDSMATTASPTPVSDGRGGTATASVSITVLPSSASDALMSRIAAAPEGSWIKVKRPTATTTFWTPLQQRARDVNGVPVGDPRKNHLGVELDGLGSEPQSPHHSGAAVHANYCWQ
jgi:hypothetical protein